MRRDKSGLFESVPAAKETRAMVSSRRATESRTSTFLTSPDQGRSIIPKGSRAWRQWLTAVDKQCCEKVRAEAEVFQRRREHCCRGRMVWWMAPQWRRFAETG